MTVLSRCRKRLRFAAALLPALALAGAATLPASAASQDGKAAEELRQRRSALSPRDAAGRAELARWARAHRLAAEAETLWREVVTLDRDHAAARLALGQYWSGSKWRPLPPPAARLKDLPPGAPGPVRADFDKARAALRAYKASGYTDAPLLRSAREALQRALKAAPELIVVRYMLGRVLLLQYDYRRGLRYVCRRSKGREDSAEISALRGALLNRLHRSREARRFLGRAIAKAPRRAGAYRERAIAEIPLGKLRSAAIDVAFSRALAPKRAGLRRLEVALRQERDGRERHTLPFERTRHYDLYTDLPTKQARRATGRELEAMRATFLTLFPKSKKPRRRPRVFYLDEAARTRYDDPRTALGYYDPALDRLVIYRSAAAKQTRITLVHEGFHQFLRGYLEDVPPWFDEGLAEHLGASVRPEGGLDPQPNRGRLGFIRAALQRERYRPVRELMTLRHAAFVDPEVLQIDYAEAWSWVYFLATSKGGGRLPLLQRYYRQLRRGASFEEAFDRTFGPQDIAALTRAWIRYTLEVR